MLVGLSLGWTSPELSGHLLLCVTRRTPPAGASLRRAGPPRSPAKRPSRSVLKGPRRDPPRRPPTDSPPPRAKRARPALPPRRAPPVPAGSAPPFAGASSRAHGPEPADEASHRPPRTRPPGLRRARAPPLPSRWAGLPRPGPRAARRDVTSVRAWPRFGSAGRGRGYGGGSRSRRRCGRREAPARTNPCVPGCDPVPAAPREEAGRMGR